ncbi:hypothetical protein [Streptomyces sp. MUM 203J]|nr:hypothetical protein [Streptomyces sp. MUM 203J]
MLLDGEGLSRLVHRDPEVPGLVRTAQARDGPVAISSPTPT